MHFKEFFEKSPKTYVYHVSPDSSIGRLRATGSNRGQQSVKMGKSGIYVAPKFKDAVVWGVSYVSGKKYNTQKPNERLKEKESGGGWHGDSGPKNYKNLTIYKIEVPKELLKNVWSSSSWEPEYFIPSEYMDQIKIVKSKTYSLNDLIIMDSRSGQKRTESLLARDSVGIEKASKTNLAARYYLELKNLYNQYLLRGKRPIINADPEYGIKNDHLIRQKIEKLRDYIYTSGKNWATVEFIDRLNPVQLKEVEKMHNDIKRMIEGL
jgi:hypothetical protein